MERPSDSVEKRAAHGPGADQLLLAAHHPRAYNNLRPLQHEPQMGNQNARWSEASDVIPMFPTLVWKIELEAKLREAIGARVLAALAHLRRDLTPLGTGQGWQSVHSLHELDDFCDLVSCVPYLQHSVDASASEE